MTGFAIALSCWAAGIAIFALMRPVEGRHALTMNVALTLLRYDEGLAQLALQTRRSEAWWRDADPVERQQIDRALTMWDLAAWYVVTRRVDRRVVLDVFSWHIVDLWESAYPYVAHRRSAEPGLWSSLLQLYVQAHDQSVAAGRQPAPSTPDLDDLDDEPDEDEATVMSAAPVQDVHPDVPAPPRAAAIAPVDPIIAALREAGPAPDRRELPLIVTRPMTPHPPVPRPHAPAARPTEVVRAFAGGGPQPSPARAYDSAATELVEVDIRDW